MSPINLECEFLAQNEILTNVTINIHFLGTFTKWKNLTFWKFIQTINLLLCRRQLYAKRYLLYYLCFLSTTKCRINLKIFKNVRIDVKSKIAKFVLRFGVLNLWKSKLLRKLTKNTWALLVLKTFTRNFMQIENKYFRYFKKHLHIFEVANNLLQI